MDIKHILVFFVAHEMMIREKKKTKFNDPMME